MPTGQYTDRVSVVIKKTTKAALTRIAEREGESVSSVSGKMLEKEVAAYVRREKRHET